MYYHEQKCICFLMRTTNIGIGRKGKKGILVQKLLKLGTLLMLHFIASFLEKVRSYEKVTLLISFHVLWKKYHPTSPHDSNVNATYIFWIILGDIFNLLDYCFLSCKIFFLQCSWNLKFLAIKCKCSIS